MAKASLLLILKKCFRTQPALYKLSSIHFIIIFHFQLLTIAIARKMEWVKGAVLQLLKDKGQKLLNSCVPGSGVILDVADAAYCLLKGDVFGGVRCLVVIGGQKALSSCVPGSGVVLDIADATYCWFKGDALGVARCAVSAVSDPSNERFLLEALSGNNRSSLFDLCGNLKRTLDLSKQCNRELLWENNGPNLFDLTLELKRKMGHIP